jgi:putative transposase
LPQLKSEGGEPSAPATPGLILLSYTTPWDAARALEVSPATYHRWQHLYGGMKATEAKRLKELELENTRLKRLLADAELDKAMLKELAEGNF